MTDVTRRRFVQTSAAGAMLATTPLALGRSAHLAGKDAEFDVTVTKIQAPP